MSEPGLIAISRDDLTEVTAWARSEYAGSDDSALGLILARLETALSAAEMQGLETAFNDVGVEALTVLHAKWYRGWQAAGIPEGRAAEFTAILVAAAVRTGLPWQGSGSGDTGARARDGRRLRERARRGAGR